MTDITRHPLILQAYEVCQAIEACGASVELTNAVCKASALMADLDKLIPDTRTGMSFGLAVAAMKQGKRVARHGWNGKGMWLKLVPEDLAETVAFQHEALKPLPWIGMKTADEHFVPWLASQTDVLSDDWTVCE
ncbi:DUF2829 domain-containing protein [Pseudomonas sp. S2_H01]